MIYTHRGPNYHDGKEANTLGSPTTTSSQISGNTQFEDLEMTFQVTMHFDESATTLWVDNNVHLAALEKNELFVASILNYILYHL